jgi:parallel beta-helix repeat protein
MNIFNSKVDVRNNTIFGFEDSIEPINCSGKVKNNTVLYAPNDAVDVNGCKNIDIENNIFYKITDKGVSVGAEQFGKSEDIRIRNNMFYACDYGVEVKNNSTANVENNTFVNNKTAIKLYLKNTGHEDDMGGTANIKDCVFYNSIDTDLNVDKFSKISVSNSISNKENTINGVAKHDIKFISPGLFDYSLSSDFVKSSLKTKIGYEK